MLTRAVWGSSACALERERPGEAKRELDSDIFLAFVSLPRELLPRIQSRASFWKAKVLGAATRRGEAGVGGPASVLRVGRSRRKLGARHR